MFDDLIGQPHAARLLTAAIHNKQPSHAYLFAGPQGSGKRMAALKFAAAICCGQGGCGSCSTCQKAAKEIHPDVITIKPDGSIIKVEQIREVNRSLRLSPHESQARVFIIGDAAAFNDESANAFLKSLEEPPAFVFFLLLASRLQAVLPTIASRCQIVRFSQVPAADIESYLSARFQITALKREAFARVCGGNLRLAEALCVDAGLAGRRELYLDVAARLAQDGNENAAGMAAEIETAILDVPAPAGGDEELPEGFKASQKQRQQDARRRERAARKRELSLALDLLASWYRDMTAVAAGARDVIVNRDYELELEDQALPSRLDNYLRAVGVIENTRKKLGYNIDLGLALTAMFYELTEVLQVA